MRKERGITLIALVITIIILLILAGVTISALGGENGLITNVQRAKKAQIKAEMREQLVLALSELQLDKVGEATLDDVTQEWANSTLEDYEPTITNDASTSGKKITMSKNGVFGKYIIDENLNITETEETTGAQLTYEVKSRDGENLQVVVTVTDSENGLKTIEFNDGHVQEANGLKSVSRDCTIQLGVEYKVKITSKNGEVKTETILINEYYHTITKNLDEGISIDNTAIKTAYNQPYKATLITEDEYILDTFTVTMGGETVEVDKKTGVIDIEKVTGDIVIIVKTKKLEIIASDAIVSADTSATKSDPAGQTTKGTPVYIMFTATLNVTGEECTIDKTMPYEVSTNGTYTFIVTGIYGSKTITKEIAVKVDQYEVVGGFVQYDAGEWTAEEISELQNKSLYNINISKTASNTEGLNFTFGGFTYKEDTTNASYINDGTIITSRNQSVGSYDNGTLYTPKYEGWQILESEQNDGKIYVTKLIHAGSPENFAYYSTNIYDSSRVEYMLSSGLRRTDFNTFKNGTEINPRNWDMYKDKKLEEKDYIEDVYVLYYGEAVGMNKKTLDTGAYYWLASKGDDYDYVYYYNVNLGLGYDWKDECWGIRPVVQMKEGVYIASGDGTEASPYVLAKEPTE